MEQEERPIRPHFFANIHNKNGTRIPETSPLRELHKKPEAQFIKAWGELRRNQSGRLITELQKQYGGKSIKADELLILNDSAFWAQWADELESIIKPFLSDVFSISSRSAADELGMELESGTIEEMADDWSGTHAEALTKKPGALFDSTIVDTDKKRIAGVANRWLESEDLFFELLQETIDNIITNPSRPRLISATESTRANAAAQARTWNNLDLMPADHIKEVESYFPQHAGCRCWPSLIPREGIRFNTAMDEMVDKEMCAPLSGKIIVEVKSSA
jgi:hypothetical protein